MNTTKPEEILVVSRAKAEDYIKLPEQGIQQTNISGLKDLFHDKLVYFTERQEAETNPDEKQLIPYCILRTGNKILRYTRGSTGGEARLHAKKSIGIGGHINPIDQTSESNSFNTYLEAVKREIQEEVGITIKNVPEPVCIINDDSNDVGKVHLGIVHVIDISNEDAQSAEDAIENLEEVTLETLRAESDTLETWSQLVAKSNILE